MRTRYRYDADMDCVVEIRDGSNYYEPETERSANVIGDDVGAGVNGLRHMPSGKMLDSKSAHRKENRARGLREVGNEVHFEDKQPEPSKDYYVRETIAAAEQLQGDWNGTRAWADKDRERVDYMKRNQR